MGGSGEEILRNPKQREQLYELYTGLSGLLANITTK